MEITKDTKVSDCLREYGDIPKVMEMFGMTWEFDSAEGGKTLGPFTA